MTIVELECEEIGCTEPALYCIGGANGIEAYLCPHCLKLCVDQLAATHTRQRELEESGCHPSLAENRAINETLKAYQLSQEQRDAPEDP